MLDIYTVHAGWQLCYCQWLVNIMSSHTSWCLSRLSFIPPMLYVMYIEPLCAAIRRHPDIHGINIPHDTSQGSVKVSCYADDTTCFVTSKSSFKALDKVLCTYQAVSSAHLNRQMSIGLWVGGWKDHQDSPMGITWGSEHINILGLHFCPSHYDSSQFNWDSYAKLHRTLGIWKNRDLSYSGRAKVVSTFTLMKLFYVCHTFSMPLTTMRQFEDIIWNFLWRDYTPLVKRSVCISLHSRGGLGMPHLACCFAAIQLRVVQ